MSQRILFLAISLLPFSVSGQTNLSRISSAREGGKDSQGSVASANPVGIDVSKTAAVNGHDVCGKIRIKNTGSRPATVTAIADSLEVHFPSGGSSSLPAGSTSNWYKVANVPITLPAPIAPGSTTTIDYCFSLCQAADYPGANTMRNVVAVTVSQASTLKTYTTRSVSFPPPTLDCRACCMPDGSCRDTVATDCAAAGGRAQGSESECATTECPQACCHADDTCSDDPPSVCQNAGNHPKGPGTDCDSTECCQPVGENCGSFADCCGENTECEEHTCCIRLAETGCTAQSDCCNDEDFAVAFCQDGRCCAPNGAEDSCHDAGDCCDANATCNGRTCCIALGATGCTSVVGVNDCCRTFGTAICEEGRCCAPTGASESCSTAADCCNPSATCDFSSGDDFGTCCIRAGATGCEDSFDCCDDGPGVVTCSGGKCCAPSGIFGSCSADTDCCIENETCNLSGVCCVAIGQIGCDTAGAHCCDFPGSTIVCDGTGRCCGPTGIPSSCTADSDCCDPNATCNDGTCCVQLGTSGCETGSDCCDGVGVTCNSAGKCCVPNSIHDSCSANSDCCNESAICDIFHGCCIATGTTGCFGHSDCCDGGAICNSGTCCKPNGSFCADSANCCGNAICSNSECCIPQFGSGCFGDSDCCSGLVCNGGACEGVIGP